MTVAERANPYACSALAFLLEQLVYSNDRVSDLLRRVLAEGVRSKGENRSSAWRLLETEGIRILYRTVDGLAEPYLAVATSKQSVDRLMREWARGISWVEALRPILSDPHPVKVRFEWGAARAVLIPWSPVSALLNLPEGRTADAA